MPEMRCRSRLHGIIDDRGVVEVKCGSRFCGAHRGVLVFHKFDATTGKLLGTDTYRDPSKELREARA